MEGINAAIGSAREWLVDALSDGNNPDELVFSMLVSLLFWFLAYNATWHIYRIDRVWRVILPPGLVLLVNMVIYSGRDPLDRHLVLFLFMALSLIARSNLENSEWQWSLSGIRVPTIVRRQFAAIGIVMSLLSLVFAWGAPTHGLQERLNAFQEFLAFRPHPTDDRGLEPSLRAHRRRRSRHNRLLRRRFARPGRRCQPGATMSFCWWTRRN